MKTNKLILNLAALLGVAFTTQLHAALLNPTNFTSLGTFDVTNGAYVIDTDALTISETNGVSTNILFNGVIDDQGGQADSFGLGGAVTNVGPLGIPYIAVFTFDDLSLDGTATFTVTGHRALALLSQGDALINVALSLNGQRGRYGSIVSVTNNFSVPGGVGGAGGFAGGDMVLNTAVSFTSTGDLLLGTPLPQPGIGPGGGPAGTDETDIGAGGSFGSVGVTNDANLMGVVYGNLANVLQGGSGGGAGYYTGNPASTIHYGSAAGGGGALEIDAVGLLKIGLAATLKADGAQGYEIVYGEAPGGGSGGGIRLAGDQLIVDGSVAADSFGAGGGGRILLRGLTGQRFTTDPGLVSLDNLSVKSLTNYFSSIPVLQGVIRVEPALGDVLVDNTYELGSITNLTATTNTPEVVLMLRDILDEGTLTVPAGGITYTHSIELRGPVAQITGADPLTMSGQLSGNGTIEVPLINGPSGTINTINNRLTFTQLVENSAGGQINGINGTFVFNGGLNNLGAMNLINTTVNGNVTNNGAMPLAGTNTFTGVVSGAGNFSGTGAAQFSGTYSPGNSPAAVTFGGDVAFGPAATLHMELGGTNAGSQYDQLNVSNSITFGGTLVVVLINSFIPAAGQVFYLINAGTELGSFVTVNLPVLPGGLEWQNNLSADGTITVIASTGSGPQFGSVVLSGSGLIFSGTGGVTNGSYVLLSSTNVATPLINWVPVTTNPFDLSGNFLLTNPVNPNRPQEFYRLQLQ